MLLTIDDERELRGRILLLLMPILADLYSFRGRGRVYVMVTVGLSLLIEINFVIYSVSFLKYPRVYLIGMSDPLSQNYSDLWSVCRPLMGPL